MISTTSEINVISTIAFPPLRDPGLHFEDHCNKHLPDISLVGLSVLWLLHDIL